MPIITRNQFKNTVAAKALVPSTILGLSEKLFCAETKVLLARCDSAYGKENKMRVALEIFEKVNKELPEIIASQNQNNLWINFVCCVFNKINQLNDEYNSGDWHEIDKKLLDKFLGELSKAKEFTSEIIRNYNGPYNTDIMIKAKNEHERLSKIRPRRNIKRVNYTGMDMIEPENEFDGITNIWADLTIQGDPDYEFEEDEDDEDDEEEDKTRWAKIHPQLSSKEKSELKQHLTQLVEHHMVRRNIARVNYTGMDMNEEDEGQIHVAKRCFEDGKVKYVWKSYLLSEANEIGDEDYVDEEKICL